MSVLATRAQRTEPPGDDTGIALRVAAAACALFPTWLLARMRGFFTRGGAKRVCAPGAARGAAQPAAATALTQRRRKQAAPQRCLARKPRITIAIRKRPWVLGAGKARRKARGCKGAR